MLDTKLVLLNCLYFKADWEEPFEEGSSREQEFTLKNAEIQKVTMMKKKDYVGYFEDKSFQMISMPYEGPFDMDVLLPKKGQDLLSFSQNFKAEQYRKILKTMEKEKVKIFLPKFEFEKTLPLNELCKKFGLKKSFSMEADFSGFSDNNDLFISELLHKAKIIVDEKSTEAAAVTEVIMDSKSAADIEEPKTFRADRPFLFIIRHRENGQILFMGQFYAE